jgi:glycosyltransferase involved in cell wall biosynthesis
MALHVLLTVHQFLPEYASGTEVLTYSVASELMRRGHRVSVFTAFPTTAPLADGARFDQVEYRGIDVYRFHHDRVPMGGQSVTMELEYINKLSAHYFAQLIARIKPDILHCFHLSRLGICLIDGAAAAGLPAYYTPTDFWSVCPTYRLILEDGSACAGPSRNAGNCVRHLMSTMRGGRAASFARFVPDAVADAVAKLTVDGMLPPYPFHQDVAAVARRKDFNTARLNALHGIVSPTRMMTAVLVGNGVDRRLIRQSAYGIDLDGYDKYPRHARGSGAVKFGFIGTLSPHKGCHVLIDAFRHVEPGRARLYVYGNTREFPGYSDQLERRAAGIGGVEFCGTFANDRIAEIFAGLDVLVVPSLWHENTPLVIYSAMASKCPVVGSDFSGISEVVRDGRNGLLFPAGDVMGLAERLNRLAGDRALLDRLSANCPPPKSTQDYVAELLELYAARDTAVAGRREISESAAFAAPVDPCRTS